MTGPAPARSEPSSRRVFVVLIVVAIGLVAVIVAPFAAALLFAGVVAAALLPLQDRLTRALRGHAGAAAGIVVLGVVAVAVAPLAAVATVAVTESADGVRFVSETLQSDGVAGLLRELPRPVRRPVTRAIAAVPHLMKSLEGMVGAQGGRAASAVGGAVIATGSLLLQTALMLVALFFFLVDGRRLVAWLESVSPLKAGQTSEILVEFRLVSVAVLVSSIVTAAVQAVVALAGYLVARVPHSLFFAAVTFIFGFVPAVGAGSVCVAAAGLLLVTGHSVAALFLAIWGVLVVGLTDNVLKAVLLKGEQFHGAVVFFSLLGGLATFGGIGLIVGPLIVAFLLALVRIHRRDYGAPA